MVAPYFLQFVQYSECFPIFDMNRGFFWLPVHPWGFRSSRSYFPVPCSFLRPLAESLTAVDFASFPPPILFILPLPGPRWFVEAGSCLAAGDPQRWPQFTARPRLWRSFLFFSFPLVPDGAMIVEHCVFPQSPPLNLPPTFYIRYLLGSPPPP